MVTPPTTPSVYALGKAIFQRGSYSTAIVGRDRESSQIKAFITSRLETTSHGALYLSGLPGTGKSASLGQVLEQVQQEATSRPGKVPPAVASINCMIVDKPQQIFARIYRDLVRGSEKNGKC
jgi:cell division control protein 6